MEPAKTVQDKPKSKPSAQLERLAPGLRAAIECCNKRARAMSRMGKIELRGAKAIAELRDQLIELLKVSGPEKAALESLGLDA